MVDTMWATDLDHCKDPADWGYCTCAVYSCGYSQPHRDWLTVARLEAGTAETDCSYGVGWWLYKGGYLIENPAFSTATMLDYFRGLGWEIIDANAGFIALERNDVLLRKGHTALYIGDGMQAEALRDENHAAGYEGTTPGDQDGGETMVRPLTFDWDWVIRKPGVRPSAPVPTDEGGTMTCIVSCDGSKDMWLYDGGRVVRIETEEQQETLKHMHLQATGRSMPQFHVPNGRCVIELLG